jgi:hypothetical protein
MNDVLTLWAPWALAALLIGAGIVQNNLAFVSLGAGMVGLPGVAKVAGTMKASAE